MEATTTLRKKRTGADWGDHEVHVSKQEGVLIHHLRKPNTIAESITFINTNGVLAVTGDYGNWIFCREFHPSHDGYVSGYYWLEKLECYSAQDGEIYSPEDTEKLLQEGIDGGLEDYGYEEERLEEAITFYKECLTHVDHEDSYVAFAHGNEMPSFIDHEDIPIIRNIKPRLQIIFDGFEEICRRMEKGEINEA